MTAAKPRPTPCPTCPYRQAVPSGVWEESEYDKLPDYDGSINDQAMAGAFAPFHCHSTPDRICSGWAGHRDPSDLLAVRLGIARGAVDVSIIDYKTAVKLFRSGAEAAEHGKREISEPGYAARKATGKIRKLRARS